MRSGEIQSPRQTPSDETKNCVMKSARGAAVRDSDPPSGRSVHNTADDTWRAPARDVWYKHIWALMCRKQTTKILDPWPTAKNTHFFRFGRRAYDAADNLSPPRPRIHLISSRPSSTFIGLARHEVGWPWVDSMSRSKVYRRVSCFWSACWHFQRESTRPAACSLVNKSYIKTNMFSVFPIAAVRECLQPIHFWIV